MNDIQKKIEYGIAFLLVTPAIYNIIVITILTSYFILKIKSYWINIIGLILLIALTQFILGIGLLIITANNRK